MRTFISYDSDTKELAGRIKRYLDGYDFGCFLAHDDIIPQDKWAEVIELSLEECTLFMPLLTPGFKTSFYCQQETGYAYCRGIEILSVLISEPPMGFLYDKQGITFNEERFDASCWKIVKHIGNKKQFSGAVIDKIIDEFYRSNSFEKAGENAEKMLPEFKFTSAQARRIMECIEDNPQIKESRRARPVIYKFIDKYGDVLDPDLVERYKDR